VGLEIRVERLEAADDVLRRIGAIDPEDELLRTAATISASASSTAALVASSSSSSGSTEIGATSVRRLTGPSSRPRMSWQARTKFRRQRSEWNPITSFASRPS